MQQSAGVEMHAAEKFPLEGARSASPRADYGGDQATAAKEPDEYPHGPKLVMLIASLLLSMFLVALDNVSQSSVSRTT
jgi:hypothetical protein